MHKNIYSIYKLFPIIVVAVLLMSCEKASLEQNLVNQWESESPKETTFKIKSDKSFYSKSYGKEFYGTYTVSSDSIIDVSIPIQNQNLTIDSVVHSFMGKEVL